MGTLVPLQPALQHSRAALRQCRHARRRQRRSSAAAGAPDKREVPAFLTFQVRPCCSLSSNAVLAHRTSTSQKFKLNCRQILRAQRQNPQQAKERM